jgi:hypothetical protein
MPSISVHVVCYPRLDFVSRALSARLRAASTARVTTIWRRQAMGANHMRTRVATLGPGVGGKPSAAAGTKHP